MVLELVLKKGKEKKISQVRVWISHLCRGTSIILEDLARILYGGGWELKGINFQAEIDYTNKASRLCKFHILHQTRPCHVRKYPPQRYDKKLSIVYALT